MSIHTSRTVWSWLASRRAAALRCGLALLALPALVWSSNSAQAQQAQVHAKDLIGYAVESVGPKHEGVEQAIQAFTQGNVDGARDLLDEAYRKDPNLPPPDITLAKLYMMANQGAAARALLEKVVNDYPDDPEPILLFGEQAVAEGRATDAQLLFDASMAKTTAWKGNPLRGKNFVIRSHAGLATVAEARENWGKSIDELKAWLAADEKNVVALQRLGRAQFMKGEEKEAYVSFLESNKSDPEMAHADVIIARLYEQKGDRENAERFMDRALRNKSSNLQTRLAAIRWLVETEQINKAKPELDALIKDHPDSVDSHLFAGIVDWMLEDQGGALKHLEDAYLKEPSNFDAGNQLALFLISRPEEEMRNRALKYAENNYRIHGKNPEAHVTLGWVYYQMGRTKEAEQLLNNALKGGRLSADSSYFVAKIFWDRGKNDIAKDLLTKALDSKRVFVHRNDAKSLLAKIAK